MTVMSNKAIARFWLKHIITCYVCMRTACMCKDYINFTGSKDY